MSTPYSNLIGTVMAVIVIQFSCIELLGHNLCRKLCNFLLEFEIVGKCSHLQPFRFSGQH